MQHGSGELNRAHMSQGCIEQRKGQKEHTIPCLVEAMLRVAMAREDDNVIATVLQADGGVDHEPLGASDSQVGMQEDDGLLWRRCRFGHRRFRPGWLAGWRTVVVLGFVQFAEGKLAVAVPAG